MSEERVHFLGSIQLSEHPLVSTCPDKWPPTLYEGDFAKQKHKRVFSL